MPNQDEIDAARAEGIAMGASAERQRIAAIMGSEAAKDRPAIARKLALNTDISAADALAFMSDLPAESLFPSGYRTIAERAAEQVEAGGDGSSAEAYKAERQPSGQAAAMLNRSIDRINATRGDRGGSDKVDTHPHDRSIDAINRERDGVGFIDGRTGEH